jgi:hypothetical protein
VRWRRQSTRAKNPTNPTIARGPRAMVGTVWSGFRPEHPQLVGSWSGSHAQPEHEEAQRPKRRARRIPRLVGLVGFFARASTHARALPPDVAKSQSGSPTEPDHRPDHASRNPTRDGNPRPRSHGPLGDHSVDTAVASEALLGWGWTLLPHRGGKSLSCPRRALRLTCDFTVHGSPRGGRSLVIVGQISRPMRSIARRCRPRSLPSVQGPSA